MKLYRLFVAVNALLFTVCVNAEPLLRIARGAEDTVAVEKHYVVGVTTPGNKAKINGEPVHVYKTGAFGAELLLKEGGNDISVDVAGADGEKSEKFTVVYAPRLAAEKVVKDTPLLECLYYAKSKEGAYLQYGDGDDRLGGSKMGYVDSGIVFKVVGERDDLCKVQLSQNRYAFMPKDKLESTSERTSAVTTGSWLVSNVGKYDRIAISLPAKLPYRSWVQLDPTTICVEIFGAMNNSNWITQRQGLEMIEWVDIQQPESDVLKAVFRLKKEYSWGYSVEYEGNALVIKVKHTPKLSLKDMTIGLDAGHGGPTSSGAVSVTGIKEKDVNLDLVMRVKGLLESRGAKVVLSRKGDEGLTMTERKKIFREAEVDIMLSIHNNAGGSPLVAKGSCTAYKSVANRALSFKMQQHLLRLGQPDFGVIGNFNFSLNSPTEYPNTLLEVLFLSSLVDEEMLADNNVREKIARLVVEGIEDYIAEVRAVDGKKK